MSPKFYNYIYKALGIPVVMYQVSRFLFVVRELSGKKVLMVGNSPRNKRDKVSASSILLTNVVPIY